MISLNLKRRHLSDSQRAMIAAKMSDWKVRDNQHERGGANLTTQSVADKLNVSKSSVKSAKVVQSKGVPELVGAVEQGEVSVSAAAIIAKEPEGGRQTCLRCL